MSIIQGTAKASGDDSFYPFEIGQSLRFDGGALTRSFSSSPTDANEFTFSGWFKFAASSNANYTHIFNASEDLAYYAESGHIGFRSSGSIFFGQFDGSNGSPKGNANLNYSGSGSDAAPFYRDPSAWYHFVWSYDYTGNVKIYVNSVEVHSMATTSNSYSFFQTSRLHAIGGQWGNVGNSSATLTTQYNGYMAELNGIDGQALDPYFFGAFKNGVWTPYNAFSTAGSGTATASDGDTATDSYGNNGYRLTFENGIETIGGVANQIRDESSNSNHWTAN